MKYIRPRRLRVDKDCILKTKSYVILTYQFPSNYLGSEVRSDGENIEF